MYVFFNRIYSQREAWTHDLEIKFHTVLTEPAGHPTREDFQAYCIVELEPNIIASTLK